MKFSEKEYKPHKEETIGKITYYLCADDDKYEISVAVDENGEIISEVPTGECACRSCVESA